MPAPPESPRRLRLLLVLLCLLLANVVVLAVANRMPGPPRLKVTAFFVMGNVVAHLLLGWAALVVFVRGFRAWTRAIRATPGAGQLFGWLAMASVAVCVTTGILLLVFGNLAPQRPINLVHGTSTVAALLTGALWLAARMQLAEAPAARVSRAALGLMTLIAVPGVVLLLVAGRMVEAEARIVNPPLAPVSMEQEGDGPTGRFFPSSVQSVDNKFFPPEYFTDNESCGEAGCHPDIYQQWKSSAHHRGSFNNQWYRKSVEYMQEVVGTQPSKWCGGCHDMAILLTEMPGTGKSRFDFPIKDQIWPPQENKEAHSGIGCAACHSTVHVKSTMGNGDYVADYPPMHEYVISKNPLLKWTTKQLTRLSPSAHKKTFLKPFHRQDTAKFCSACHKVHLDIPVNGFRWFRGFNDYDAWQQSGVSGFGARSFYYPNKDGKPDFKKCADCHMPLVPSRDAGNIAGKVHSHRFPAANTALPYVNHDKEQLEITQRFLKDGALSIDIFAVRREKPVAGGPRSAEGGQADRGGRPSPANRREEGESASLFGEAATTGHVGSIAAASTAPMSETVVAPINRGGVAVQRGRDALVDVVVRTRKVGHAFPGGTFDAFDVWVELQARDDRGRVIYWSGGLEWPDGPVEKSAHQYRALLVDGASNEINKRNAWAARARIYARAIPPGAADTVRYRLKVPKDCGSRITITAKLNYRKFSWWNTQFAFGGRPEMPGKPQYSKGGFIEGTALGKDPKNRALVTADYDKRPMRFDADLKVVAAKTPEIPKLPITTLCQDTVTLNVVDGDPDKATAPRKLDPKADRERWNDYGIGFMLQGDFHRATSAFQQATRIAPKWPEAHVNIARVRLLEGDLNRSEEALNRALAIYDSPEPGVPPSMVKYLKARTQFFQGMLLKNRGQYQRALDVWTQVMAVFPDDRELRNQMGRVHFLFAATDASQLDRAIEHFRHVLTIDPEDLTANYNLMLCYKGKGPSFQKEFETHRALYLRFKSDETTTHLAGPYKRKNPWDNHEAQMIHEHASGPLQMGSPPRSPQIVGKSDRRAARSGGRA